MYIKDSDPFMIFIKEIKKVKAILIPSHLIQILSVKTKELS